MAPVNNTLAGGPNIPGNIFRPRSELGKKRGFLQRALLLKLGGAMALIVGFAIIGMASSWVIAEPVQGSGEAINLAGNLRMQAVPT